MVIDSNSGIIDVSASAVGNYIITYAVGNCSYYQTTQNIAITDATLKINESIIKTFKIYPNPTKSVLNFQAASSINKIQIFNTVGQLIGNYNLNIPKGQIDTSALSQGMYLLKVIGENNTTLMTKQLLKINQ